MASGLEERMKEALDQRRADNAYRYLSTERQPVDLLSNDYLGLARGSALPACSKAADVQKGSTGSRLLSGNTPFHEKVEEMLADFHQAEAALLFNSGYQANLALLSSLLTKDDTILYDAYLHASLRQGLQLSYANSYKFQHNDLNSLYKKYKAARGQVLIVVESLYSMDGDEAPLEQLVDFSDRHQCHLVVDEAHATGIIGRSGAGLVQEYGLSQKVTARIHTFGKAVGSQGAAVVGSETLKAYLVNFAKPFIYSTAPAPVLLNCIWNNYHIFPGMEDERAKVKALSAYLEGHLKKAGWSVIHGRGPIKALLCPGKEQVKEFAKYLQKEGFEVRPIVSPTVPEGQERIRICLHAYNTYKELDAFIDAVHAYASSTPTKIAVNE